MYAIIESGGKQFRVEEGAKINVEKLAVEPGASLDLDKVLMVGEGDDVQVGAPYVDGAKVSCEVVGHGRGKKIIVFHKRRRQDSATKQGHRQDYTTLKVTAISA
jgi:large subunit ribosomal protein L21